jgi:hypothetical protein
MSAAPTVSILNLQKHMVVECRTPECRLECNAYVFLIFPAVMFATSFAVGSPVTAELFKRLTSVGGLWLEAIVLMWLTAWPVLAVLLILVWGRIRRCW